MTNADDTNADEHDAQAEPAVVLLPDEPADADEFDAKAHDNVARALANLIETEAGGMVIGLEGPWGVGKSTVVRLLRSKLEQPASKDQPATRVLIFDAWAHQGDPLRRTFLEKLAGYLETVGWLSSQSAEGFRATLSGSTSTTHTTSTGRLSLEGALASAAAVLLPLGAVLLANDFHSHHRAAQIIGLVLLVAPLIVVGCFLLAKVVGILSGGREGSGWRRRLAQLPTFSFFAKTQDIDTTTTGFHRGEPTSVEFERTFSGILDESLTGSRRLLVVLDNLDRVQESDAKTILATMQTFTSTPGEPAVPWRPKVWTLIPYDPSGFDRLWNSDEDNPLTEPTSAAFIEKIFQVRFETPPLVLSDWRGYLSRLLRAAIPGVKDEEVQRILRLRAAYRGVAPEGVVARDAPTPRQLKQFVNQMGGVRRQREDIPLIHIAYHTLLRRDRIDVSDQLIAGALPHPGLRHVLGDAVEEDLAAIHFGTERSLAQQLLLGGALENAFAASDSAAVEQLKDRAGFIDALDFLDLPSRAADGGVELTSSVAVLDDGKAFGVPGVVEWLTDAVLPVAKVTKAWTPAGRAAGTGLAVLLDRLSAGDDEELKRLLSRVEANPREADTDGHLEGFAGLLDELAKRGRLSDDVRVRGTIPSERLASSLAYFGTKTQDARSRAALEVSMEPSDVAQALVQAATSENSADVLAALDVLLTRPERVDLGAVASGCIDWLTQQDPTSAEQAGALLGAIDRARQAGLADSLTTAADDGTLMNLVGSASANGWSRQAADASMLHLVAQPGIGSPAVARQVATGEQLTRSVMTDPSADPPVTSAQHDWLAAHPSEAFDLLLRVSAADSAFQPWVDQQLRGLHEASVLVVSPAQYLAAWPELLRILGSDGFGEVTSDFLNREANRKALTSGSQDPALALAVLEAASGENYAPELQTWASGIVKNTSSADWQAALASPAGAPVLDLALEVSGWKGASVNPPGLSDALHSHFPALAAGEAAWQPDDDVFARLTSLLSAAARKSVASQLCAALEVRDGQVSPGLFATYGTFLAGERDFRRHQKLPNFLERAVAHNEWDSVRWIVSLAKQHDDTLRSHDQKDATEYLRTRVREKLSELSDTEEVELPPALSSLSELLES